ncbi:hypothetical protein CYY_002260 [Polysphondylium violaceum]|uniref:Protein kinase domain-containing protein n=1 Tax=Polysphondylium violaceum TaxID=133409 RepID=A0A8J4V736_9MYCE|nr:hypothetical protein CYY_002260 [Polysphondylium violaceum]
MAGGCDINLPLLKWLFLGKLNKDLFANGSKNYSLKSITEIYRDLEHISLNISKEDELNQLWHHLYDLNYYYSQSIDLVYIESSIKYTKSKYKNHHLRGIYEIFYLFESISKDFNPSNTTNTTKESINLDLSLQLLISLESYVPPVDDLKRMYNMDKEILLDKSTSVEYKLFHSFSLLHLYVHLLILIRIYKLLLLLNYNDDLMHLCREHSNHFKSMEDMLVTLKQNQLYYSKKDNILKYTALGGSKSKVYEFTEKDFKISNHNYAFSDFVLRSGASEAIKESKAGSAKSRREKEEQQQHLILVMHYNSKINFHRPKGIRGDTVLAVYHNIMMINRVANASGGHMASNHSPLLASHFDDVRDCHFCHYRTEQTILCTLCQKSHCCFICSVKKVCIECYLKREDHYINFEGALALKGRESIPRLLYFSVKSPYFRDLMNMLYQERFDRDQPPAKERWFYRLHKTKLYNFSIVIPQQDSPTHDIKIVDDYTLIIALRLIIDHVNSFNSQVLIQNLNFSFASEGDQFMGELSTVAENGQDANPTLPALNSLHNISASVLTGDHKSHNRSSSQDQSNRFLMNITEAQIEIDPSLRIPARSIITEEKPFASGGQANIFKVVSINHGALAQEPPFCFVFKQFIENKNSAAMQEESEQLYYEEKIYQAYKNNNQSDFRYNFSNVEQTDKKSLETLFYEEVEKLALLQASDFVVKMPGITDDDAQKMGMVLELSTHGSLKSNLFKYRSWNTMIQLLLDICVGMMDVHKANIIHRDLKPDNILIFPNSLSPIGISAKITDFGASVKRTLVHDNNYTSTFHTDDYVPEEYGKYQYDGILVDIYSYGCIAFEMITKHRWQYKHPGALHKEEKKTFTEIQTDLLYIQNNVIPGLVDIPALPVSINPHNYCKTCNNIMHGNSNSNSSIGTGTGGVGSGSGGIGSGGSNQSNSL